MNENCLSYWFPKMEAAGLPVPRTSIVTMPGDLRGGFYQIFDGKAPSDAAIEWLNNILLPSVLSVGIPCFLRTGQTSAKHQWDKTCFVRDPSRLLSHVANLIEFSECCDFLGLPWDVWVARELLPTEPMIVADKYRNMPVNREFRYFVRDGDIECCHPYWPKGAVIDGTSQLPDDFEVLYDSLCCQPPAEAREHRELAKRAGAAVGGYWSVDILETTRGWYVTDMANGDDSWHWPECELKGVAT